MSITQLKSARISEFGPQVTLLFPGNIIEAEAALKSISGPDASITRVDILGDRVTVEVSGKVDEVLVIAVID